MWRTLAALAGFIVQDDRVVILSPASQATHMFRFAPTAYAVGYVLARASRARRGANDER
jgi:hypothetical protein